MFNTNQAEAVEGQQLASLFKWESARTQAEARSNTRITPAETSTAPVMWPRLTKNEIPSSTVGSTLTAEKSRWSGQIEVDASWCNCTVTKTQKASALRPFSRATRSSEESRSGQPSDNRAAS